MGRRRFGIPNFSEPYAVQRPTVGLKLYSLTDWLTV